MRDHGQENTEHDAENPYGEKRPEDVYGGSALASVQKEQSERK
jgi:hypothetical protein